MKTNSITSLPASPADDRRGRLRRYVFTMSVRVVCFVVAVCLHDVWSILPLVLAGVIPWVAVVVANAGNRRADDLVRPGGELVRVLPDDDRERTEQEREERYREDQRARAAWAHAEQERAERERAAASGGRSRR
ncbi:hypothetical protein DEI92_09375 [Curtobacterium sp. MCBD17_034]|uniref:DUF3099 domain-containing protein n=1 Tax=unclassified Curtobacterium TaxID=257496 RepID=UPI000DA9A20C|nr:MULTISPECIES: DUF3099 domain-containing protein [unclassified Curtobacterium]PZF59198.1 hypothetical protein DEI92_09375 [Curtobacterium sp. MCBD17_034]PZM34260.1 hypothetical protein DEI90_08760 [Curtobacterium sp. MCBD17_031]